MTKLTRREATHLCATVKEFCNSHRAPILADTVEAIKHHILDCPDEEEVKLREEGNIDWMALKESLLNSLDDAASRELTSLGVDLEQLGRIRKNLHTAVCSVLDEFLPAHQKES